jgi:hypothetical protein
MRNLIIHKHSNIRNSNIHTLEVFSKVVMVEEEDDMVAAVVETDALEEVVEEERESALLAPIPIQLRVKCTTTSRITVL